MLFNSLPFALFLPTVVALFWLLPRGWRTQLLLIASYLFYGWWDPRFLGLIFLSTVVDFMVALRMSSSGNDTARKRWLWASVVVNLGVLGFFKYWDFFIGSAASVLASLGVEPGFATLRIVLPVGISFYTFQTMSYTVDVYRRKLEPERDFRRFALFVAFFPQLVAGPIERARRLLPQLHSFPERLADVDWSGATALIVRGLFRKLVIADGIAPIVNEVFANPDVYSGVSIALGIVGFALQIYGDFAGYTDIARGTAKLFGVDLMANFRAPFLARGFSDFWQRWHISLSTWLRDYLYIPLGGNRNGRARTYVNLMATMLLGGLWHGAGWGFVIWGGLHGTYLVLERWLTLRFEWDRSGFLPPWLVFGVTTLTWIPFRAGSLDQSAEMLRGLFDSGGAAIAVAPLTVGFLATLTYAIDHFDSNGVVDPTRALAPYFRGLALGAAMVTAVLYSSHSATPFIYFQF